MARVNVFLPDDLLKTIDAAAKESHVGRSTLVQTALTRYLEALRTEREEAQRRREMDEACAGMDALAEKLGKWDPVTVIREFRENRSVSVHKSKPPYGAAKPKIQP